MVGKKARRMTILSIAAALLFALRERLLRANDQRFGQFHPRDPRS
ncbi:MAG TPA: hypothetical protein VKI20_00635 [Acidimicrobiales bacterium]|nr:hypothetical protein [Acidimicrobiales bacterium]